MANSDKRTGLQKKVSSVFKDVPIPQDNGETQAPGAHAPNETPVNPANRMSTDRPISQSSLIKKINQANESLDKTEPDQSDNIFPKPTTVDHQVPQSPFIKTLNQAEDSSDKAEPDQSVGIFPKPTPANHQMPQSPLIKTLNQAEDSVDKAEPEQSANVFPKPMTANHQMPQSSLLKTLNQAEDSSDKAEPEQSANVFPKPMTANHQMPQSPLLKTLNQAEDSSDKAEPEQSANVFPKPMTANHQTPKIPLVKKLPQSRESSKEPEPVKQLESDPFIEMPSQGLVQQIKDKLFTPKPGASPAKQKALVIMVPILLVVMVFLLRQFISKAPDKTNGAPKDNAPVEVANTGSGIEIDWQVPEPLPAITRDPIKLPGQDESQNAGQDENPGEGPNVTVVETNPVAIKVKDIVYSADKPSAFIGSKIAYVGDKVDGVTIVRIERDRVEFEKNGKRWVQKMRE